MERTGKVAMDRDIAMWKEYLRTHGELSEDDLFELEDHLRDTISDLKAGGLSDEEAFIIGVRRTGTVSSVAAEFSKLRERKLWKHLFTDPKQSGRETAVVVSLALLAGFLSRVPEIFGIGFSGVGMSFYTRNIALFILPSVVAYFAWKFSGRGSRTFLFFAVAACSAILANVYPAYATGSFDVLIGIHLPILLWVALGAVYAGRGWRNTDGRMDFIRFSGETFIYLVLILCGGAVLVAAAGMLFNAIDINADFVLREYIAVAGASAAPVVAVYLAAAKQNVIESIAPVLARIFSPLFLVLFVAFIAVMSVTGSVLAVERDLLIGFDLLLALVLGLLLYTVSARDERRGPGVNDYLQGMLILAALAVDIIALVAILIRIRDFGFTPNKTAALGENILLFVNLAVSGGLYLRFFAKKDGFRLLTVWQMKFLPVFGIWAAGVAFLFPVIFSGHL